jgi:hypothetical protein
MAKFLKTLRRATGFLIGSPEAFGQKDPLADAFFPTQFGAPKTGAEALAEPPPPTGEIEVPDRASAIEAALAREREEYLRTGKKRRGRAATILTGPQGAGTPQTAAKTLTGE